MLKPLIFLFFLSCSQQAFAFTAEPYLGVTTSGEYNVSNVGGNYKTDGSYLGIDFPFSSDGAGGYYWGVGLQYGIFKGDLESGSRSLASEADFNLLETKIILGYKMGLWSFELPVQPFNWAIISSGVNKNDERYGYGLGLELGYQLYTNLTFNLGYQFSQFISGKKASTGESGSLKNKIDFNYIYFHIGFPFGNDGMINGGGDEG